MEVDVAVVPRTGLSAVRAIVRREIQDRRNALEAARGWIPRKKWEKDNKEFLDLVQWLEEAETQ